MDALPDRLDLDRFDPMRTKSDDRAVAEGYEWSRERAFRVQDFVESLCRLYVGRWAGQTIRLMPFQQDFIWRLYGWVHKDTGLRRFREAYFESGKKQGKSPLVGALSLYHLVADGENAPEIYVNAAAREQATIIYRNVSQMIAQEPEFDGLFREIESQKRILYPEKNGVLVANSAEASTKHGLQSSLTIFDELFEQPNRDLWDAFAYAGRSRLQPLLLSITNAGEPDNEHPCFIQHKRSIAVESGGLIDVRFLGIVHGPREANPDIDDRRVWRMANPAIGFIVSESDIAAELQKAKDEGPAALQKFKQLGLGIWEKAVAKWIDMQVWNAQAATRTNEEILASGDVWAAGLDMSAGTDLTAYVRVAGNIRDGIDYRDHYWIPEATALRRQREENIPYLEYAALGWVTLIPGECIDPAVILQYILHDAAKTGGRLKRIHSDKYNAGAVGSALIDAGLDFQWFIQGPLSFHPALKTIENLVLRRMLRRSGNPLMDYCASNAVCDDKNKNQNKMLVKHKSSGRIDGMVALAEALAGLMDLIGYDGDGGELAKASDIDGPPMMIWLP
jgi:phage terminase large subunit-like protein